MLPHCGFGYNRSVSSWGLIGHGWIEDLLRRHISAGRVRHAYLFTGPEGVGRRTLALKFAQALNCEQPPEPGVFCGECRACRGLARMQHPDLHIVSAEDVGGTLEVSKVRELQRQLALTPYESRWRVALLNRFQEASNSAANALLKTLEEPPARVVLLLTAESAESLLPTIVSRCEEIRMRVLSHTELEAELEARGLDMDRASLLSRLAAGRPGQALRWVDEPEALVQHHAYLDDLLELLGQTRVERFRYVRQLTDQKKEMDEKRREAVAFVQAWLSFWRDLLLIAHDVQSPVQHQDALPQLEALKEAVPARTLLEVGKAFERTLEAIGANANLQLALETLMLDLPHLPGQRLPTLELPN